LGLSKLLVGKLLEDSTYGMESSKRIPIGLLELYDHAVVLTLTQQRQQKGPRSKIGAGAFLVQVLLGSSSAGQRLKRP
ncbi:hypothetical protein, partial [Adlercreutzia sp. ZJ473]|uniref:hypothetical protein n=1 Tax=Adlercreutzia sp. ZJ473 TaxID=2722822 RepID=UPI001C130D00